MSSVDFLLGDDNNLPRSPLLISGTTQKKKPPEEKLLLPVQWFINYCYLLFTDADNETSNKGRMRRKVPNVLIFQVSQALVTIIFAVFISDFRQKKDMAPLVDEKLTLILKLSCLFPLASYTYVLATLQRVSTLDLLAFSLTLLGIFLVAKAKLDLSKHHTWAGYCLKSSKLFAKGIYAYIRHPLYTGIYSFSLGLFLTIVPHADWQLTLATTIPLVYIMIFLAYSATQETRMLAKKLGSEFLAYKCQVHFCLPLRRYEEP